MTNGTRIFLWETGEHCGTAGSRDRALELAAEYLDGSAEALVEEARLALTAASAGGLVQGHQRTGAAWRGRYRDGEPVWRPVAAGAS